MRKVNIKELGKLNTEALVARIPFEIVSDGQVIAVVSEVPLANPANFIARHEVGHRIKAKQEVPLADRLSKEYAARKPKH